MKIHSAKDVVEALAGDVQGHPIAITNIQYNPGNQFIAISYVATGNKSAGSILIHHTQFYDVLNALYQAVLESGLQLPPIATFEEIPDRTKLN